MTDIQNFFDRLNDIESEITLFSRAMSQPVSIAERLALKSLERRRDELRDALDEFATEYLVDLCDYRIMPAARGRYPVKGVAGALSGFQDMVTSFYSAVRDRPRERARFDAEIAAASTLNVGYAYSGSLGFVLFALNDEFLPVATQLDVAVDGVMNLFEQNTVEGVRKVADQFGKASIRSFYNWSKFHTEFEFDADIRWQRGAEVKAKKLVQRRELQRVRDLIDAASEQVTTKHTIRGTLIALDTKKRTFGFAQATAKEVIRGSVDPAVSFSQQWKLPGNYEATIQKTAVHHFYTDEDVPTWKLLDLREMSEPS